MRACVHSFEQFVDAVYHAIVKKKLVSNGRNDDDDDCENRIRIRKKIRCEKWNRIEIDAENLRMQCAFWFLFLRSSCVIWVHDCSIYVRRQEKHKQIVCTCAVQYTYKTRYIRTNCARQRKRNEFFSYSFSRFCFFFFQFVFCVGISNIRKTFARLMRSWNNNKKTSAGNFFLHSCACKNIERFWMGKTVNTRWLNSLCVSGSKAIAHHTLKSAWGKRASIEPDYDSEIVITANDIASNVVATDSQTLDDM